MEISSIIDKSQKRRYYWFIVIVIALGGFLAGYDTSIIGPALIYVVPFFHISGGLSGILVSIESLFMVFGALTSGPIIDKIGRRPLLIVDAIIYIIFALTSALAINISMLILSRALVGIAVGADYAIAPAFLSELSHTNSRGRSNMTEQLMYFSGAIIAFWVGYFLSFTANWRLMFGVAVIPAIILIVVRIYLPESPRWLLSKGKIESAKESLVLLGANTGDLSGLDNEIHKRSPSILSILTDKAYKKALIIMGFFMFFVPATGINVILSYGPTIYKYLGLSGPGAILNTGISETLGIAEFLLSFLLIDRVGRRPLGVLAYIGEAASLLISIIGIIFFNRDIVALSVILIFVSMNLFLLFFHIGPGSILWTLSGEIFPTEIRGKMVGFLMAIDVFTNFVILLIFPIWQAAFGLFSFYELEFIIAAIAAVFMLLFLRETKNVPLEEVKERYSGSWIVKR